MHGLLGWKVDCCHFYTFAVKKLKLFYLGRLGGGKEVKQFGGKLPPAPPSLGEGGIRKRYAYGQLQGFGVI